MKTNSSPAIAVEYTQSIRQRSESAALVTNVVLVACGTLLLTLLAQVRVPLFPVPITGQSLGVLLLGAALGTHRSVASVLAYLMLGAVGFPVFAGGVGLAALLGPTGGYLWSFIPAAAAVGYLCERQWDRRFLWALIALYVGSRDHVCRRRILADLPCRIPRGRRGGAGSFPARRCDQDLDRDLVDANPVGIEWDPTTKTR